jgi:hypothetical protein
MLLKELSLQLCDFGILLDDNFALDLGHISDMSGAHSAVIYGPDHS